ncbi:MAG: LiaF-related protein [Kofleriaceae bacterium]
MQIDEHREQVIERLQSGFAEDRFEMEELERRLVIANTATSPAQLEALVTDLVPVSQALVPYKKVRVVFGSIERRGPWVMPQRMAARVVCGNLELDLREAQMAAGVTEIDVHITMGHIEILVPPGVTVETDAYSTLGNIEDETERGPSTQKTLRVTGKVTLGNLEVRTRRVGESQRDERHRRRWERRARRRAMRHMHWRDFMD